MELALAVVAAVAGVACLAVAGWIVHPSAGLGLLGASLLVVASRVAREDR